MPEPIKFAPEVEARFRRIERNLEITAAINAETAALSKETARLSKDNEKSLGELHKLSIQNQKALADLIRTVDAFVRTRSNGKR